MAAATYATNLTDITLAATTTGFTAIGGGGALAAETDFSIQADTCVSKATATTWDTAGTPRGGAMFNAGAGLTIPTDGAVLTWIYWWGPGVLATKANGGAEISIGNLTTAYKGWYVTGSDDWAFGGWRCYPVAPSLAADRTVGSPTATLQYFGWVANVGVTVAIGRGNPYGIDAIRYGRCDLVVTNGDLPNGYATFLGAADWDNTSTRRLGLLTPRDGAYYMQGLFQIGSSGTAADFRDSNRAIFIQNTEKVTANFNTIEVLNASTRVDWTSVSITALGTVSKGRFLATANADINIESCTFTDLGVFTFQSNSTALTSTFRRCGIVTQDGATITGCTFDAASGTTALIANSVSAVTNCDFISSGTGYAIEGFSTAGDYTVSSNTFTGYGSTGTANAALRVTATSGIVNINAPGGTTYHSAGATVNIISGQRTLTLTGIVSGSDVVILTAGTETELANIDANVGSTYAYSYTYSAATFIDVCVYKAGYVPFTVRNYLLADGDGSLPISQVLDRNYLS